MTLYFVIKLIKKALNQNECNLPLTYSEKSPDSRILSASAEELISELN